MTGDALTLIGPRAEGSRVLGGWRAEWIFRPHDGAARGGDMVRVATGAGAALYFALADAAGHGAVGAGLWARHGAFFADLWDSFLAGGGPEAVVDPLDARLVASGCDGDTLCLTLGRWEPDGRLEFVTCGFGTHALVRTARGPWWTEPARLFGLKLGWLGPAERKSLGRGLVCHLVEGVDRVVLLTDGVLVDDHRDPERTLAGLAAMNRRCAALGFEQVLSAVLEGAPDPCPDDLTALVVEPATSRTSF